MYTFGKSLEADLWGIGIDTPPSQNCDTVHDPAKLVCVSRKPPTIYGLSGHLCGLGCAWAIGSIDGCLRVWYTAGW